MITKEEHTARYVDSLEAKFVDSLMQYIFIDQNNIFEASMHARELSINNLKRLFTAMSEDQTKKGKK